MMETAKIPEFCNRGYAEVNLDAIAENMKNMKEHIAQETKLVGVLKAGIRLGLCGGNGGGGA